MVTQAAEVGREMACRTFERRSRGKRRRQVEVHLSEDELAMLLATAAVTAQAGLVEALDAFVKSYTPMPWGCSPETVARVETGRAALAKARGTT